MQHFKNKVVWVTGASSGIGEALVKACAAAGAKVVLTSRRADELIRVASEAKLDEENSLILPHDMEDTGGIQELTNKVLERFSQIDYLFNNAGISSRSLALDTPLDIDRKVMEINYFSVIALTKAVVPGMLKAGTGHIIVTSSVMGKIGTPLRSAYAASKHALHGFYDCLRAELADTGVHVTVICPGYVKTQVSVNAITATGDKFNKMSRFQENGMSPEKLAKKVLKTIKKRKPEAYYGGTEVAGIYLHRYAPFILWPILRNQQRKKTFDR